MLILQCRLAVTLASFNLLHPETILLLLKWCLQGKIQDLFDEIIDRAELSDYVQSWDLFFDGAKVRKKVSKV